MEIKAELKYPYTEEKRKNFIVENNHQKGYTIEEAENALLAWGYTEEEQQERNKREQLERIANLNLSKADFWIALLDRDITKTMVLEKIKLIPDEKLRAKTEIRLNDADHFWRGDPSMDLVGAMFGVTPEDLDYLFEQRKLPEKENDTNTL